MRHHRFFLGLAALMVTHQSTAQPIPLHDEWLVSVGWVHPDASISLSATANHEDFSATASRRIRFGESSIEPLFMVRWQPFARHQFSYGRFALSHDETHNWSAVPPDDFAVLGPVVASARWDVRMRLEGMDYTYWRWGNDRWRLGVTVGVMDYRIRAGVSGQVSLPERDLVATGAATWSEHLPAPFIGAAYQRRLSPRTRLDMAGGWLRASRNNLDGEAWMARAGLQWFPWEHVGIGLAYTASSVDLTRDWEYGQASIDFTQKGIALLAHVRF